MRQIILAIVTAYMSYYALMQNFNNSGGGGIEKTIAALAVFGIEIYLISHEAGASDKRGIPLMITEHKVDAASLTDRKGGIHEVRVSESGDKTLIY